MAVPSNPGRKRISFFNIFRKRPSLEDQLNVLQNCGISLNPGVRPETIFAGLRGKPFANEPYTGLLVVMGEQGLNGEYPSDHIWHFDSECIEDHGDYARIAKRMSVLAQGGLPLENVADHVDVDLGKAWLSFEPDGQTYKWDAKVNDDWADGEIISKLSDLLESRQTGRRFTFAGLGQDCLIACCTADQLALLNSKTGINMKWLERSQF